MTVTDDVTSDRSLDATGMRPWPPEVVASGPQAVRAVLDRAVTGVFPPDDGTVEVVAAPIGRSHGVIAFSAHFFVCAPVSVDWVAQRLDTTEFSATHSPAFLTQLATALDANVGALDVVLAGTADDEAHRCLADLQSAGLTACDDPAHLRVSRARRYRHDVHAWQVGDDQDWVVLGRGVTGRWEASFEVDSAGRGHGRGRRLAAAARALTPAGQPTFVQVSPGNVASLRAVLAAGYRVVGSEVLLPPRQSGQPL